MGLALAIGGLLKTNWWFSYAFLGVVTVLAFALSPMKSYLREWRFYQRKYNRLVYSQPGKKSEAEIGVRQIWVEKANRVDRCTSCHVGMDVPAATHLSQPFKAHPIMYHDTHMFGCTICHRGDGQATSYSGATGLQLHSEQQILPKRYMEAACGKCHKGTEVPESPVLNQGRQLLNKLNCVGCHEIPGAKASFVVPLDGIGVRVERKQLFRWLRNPALVKPETKMPNFFLSETDAIDLTDYLLSFTKLADGSQLPELTEKIVQQIKSSSRAELGGKLFREARCISCHKVNGKGGPIAEDIGTIGSRLSVPWLWNYLENPKRLLPNVPMPRYGLNDEQRISLLGYISSELRDFEFDESSITLPDRHTNYSKRGEELWKMYNCSGCHRLNGAPIDGEKGPSLKGIGVRPAYAIDVGKRKDVPIDLSAYLNAKLADPRSLFDSLRMPVQDVPDSQRTAIITALLAIGGEEELPPDWIVPEAHRAETQIQGSMGRILNRYACLSCHTIAGSGGPVAPELVSIGSQMQADWIKGYLTVPASRRPILTERMPNFFFPNTDKDTIIQYFKMAFISDSIDQAASVIKDKSLVQQGSSLFYDKFSCSGCHQVKGKGGYVGPPLDGASKRLKSGWVERWLENPQKWKPNTVEPRTIMTSDEKSAIVAFVMSL